MRKVLTWVGIGLGVLLGTGAMAVLVLYFLAETRLTKNYAVRVEPVAIPAAPADHGDAWPLLLVRFCEDCHGANLAGTVMVDDNMARLVSSNLTAGQGGVGSWYTDDDWVRALRHGVRPNGRPLIGMPSDVWTKLSDEDLGQIIAFVKTVPAVDNPLPATEVRLVGRVMMYLGLLPPDVIPAEVIDHDAPRRPAPTPAVTAEYGRYLAQVCTVCHGPDLAGGFVEGQGRNLTPAGDLAHWSEADFIHTVRTGVTPQGEQLKGELFPYKDLGQMSDDELKAIWLYLQTLPPVETK